MNTSYEIQDTAGLTLPQATAEFIELTRKLTQDSLSNPSVDVPNMDRTIAIDPSIWTVILENLPTDDDSYVNKGCDFMTYRDPVDSFAVSLIARLTHAHHPARCERNLDGKCLGDQPQF